MTEPVDGMSAAWPPAFLPSLRDPDATPGHTGRAELPRAVLKHLNPLGHELTLWSAASSNLVGRLNRDRLPPELNTFLRQWMPVSGPEMPAGAFTVLLGESIHGWQIAASSLAWLNDPAWTALLRLPALRSAWMNDLRASHFDHLLNLLPSAWLMDATPLPPGAVIPELEMASWAELVRRHGQGHVFELYPRDQSGNGRILSDDQTAIEWQEALSAGESIIVERHSASTWLLASYQHQGHEIHLSTAWTSREGMIEQVV